MCWCVVVCVGLEVSLLLSFRPVRDFLVVEVVDSEVELASGIVLPDSSRKGNLRGRVVRLGEGRWDSGAGVFRGFCAGVGDVVLFNEFAGFELGVDGGSFRVIRDVDIVGVFED